jgi:aminopeptidase N
MCFRCTDDDALAADVRDAGARGPRPFALPGAEPRYARDRVARVKHVRLDVALDFERRRIDGTATTTLAAITDGLASITLDAVELEVREATDGAGARLEFSHDGERLVVRFARPLAAGEEAVLRIAYGGAPRRGLYFVRPDAHYPAKAVHAWTQGQDEDSRYWFPCYDYPNEKFTSEVAATVPARMFALSNGRLLSTTEDPARGTKTYHWSSGTPHVAYLVTLVAGEFESREEEVDGVPLQFYVPRGRAGDIDRSFAKTGAMVRHFQWVTGRRYPYEKYAQICVGDFIFGGMENTSATTLTDQTLHDAKAHEDQPSDSLVAHELAHQWFGDLLTCKDWSHGWLNEGFATYFESLWKEKDAGWDEMRWYLSREAETYFEEDSGSYRRPIVTRVYKDPIEVFDRHLYEKGGLVLDMLRFVLGDEPFWASVRHYVKQNEGRTVVTADLARAVEEATGRNVEWFLDQWVFRGGHPELEVSSDWDDEKKLAKVVVKQTQKEDEVTPLFRTPVELGFIAADGAHVMRRVELEAKREQAFYFALPAKPRALRFDPGDRVLKKLTLKNGEDQLRELLARDPDAMIRCRAARALGEKGSAAAVEALARAAREDAAWMVRGEAARALGVVRSERARDALISALEGEAHVKARRALVEALGEFREEEAAGPIAAALEKVLGGDRSYLVEHEAARSLGRVRSPRALAALTGPAFERRSHADVLQTGIAAGLGELRDARGIEWLRKLARYGAPPAARGAAIAALGKLGRAFPDRREEVRDVLENLLDDPWFRAQVAVPGALGALGDAAAIGPLERARDRALDGRVRRRASEAIRRLAKGKHREEEVKQLRDDLDKLREENGKLRDRLDKLEAAAASPAPAAADSGPAPAAPAAPKGT